MKINFNSPPANDFDADGNGAVSASDGVQALRSAAGLASVRTLATCDVDASGAVTVIDGVVVLRIAAGLPIQANCGTEPEPVHPDLAEALGELVAYVEAALAYVPAASTAPGPAPAACDNTPTGEVRPSPGALELVQCRIGARVFDGELLNGARAEERSRWSSIPGPAP